MAGYFGGFFCGHGCFWLLLKRWRRSSSLRWTARSRCHLTARPLQRNCRGAVGAALFPQQVPAPGAVGHTKETWRDQKADQVKFSHKFSGGFVGGVSWKKVWPPIDRRSAVRGCTRPSCVCTLCVRRFENWLIPAATVRLPPCQI